MKQKLFVSGTFVIAGALIIWGFASASAQVRVPEIPRGPSLQMPPTIVHTPPPIETEPPHFHPHHSGHDDLATPQPTIAPYSPAR